jgi:hypothetical protein
MDIMDQAKSTCVNGALIWVRSLPYEEVKTIEDDDISEDETSLDGENFVNPADLRE